MKLEIVFTAAAIKETPVSGKVLVAFDVFRATSTIVAAFEKGCAAVIPVCSVDEVWEVSREAKERNKEVLVAGELHGIKVDGMDLGNSPVEYMAAEIEGKTIVLSTCNGTHAIRNAQGASRILIGSLLNARPVALKLIKEGKDVVFGCAGRLGEFSLEDFTAAGAVASFIRQAVPEVQASDPVLAAEACFLNNRKGLTSFLARGKHGKYLEKIGFGEDVRFCSRLNASELVPEFRGDKITL